LARKAGNDDEGGATRRVASEGEDVLCIELI
jgi:hypothetical protein